MNNITTIGFDADDTLWHNERHFQLTEQHFCDLLADYSNHDHLRERLLEAEKRNIGHYGFGAKGFTLSLIETAIEVTGGKVSSQVISRILEAGRELLNYPVETLPGVTEALEALTGDYRLIVITKGDLIDQERKLAASGVDHFFDAVEIVSAKEEATYHRIFTHHGSGASNAMMIGNSLKSDILPALEAGAWGVHIPYEVTWAMEHAEEPQSHQRFRRLDRIDEVIKLLA